MNVAALNPTSTVVLVDTSFLSSHDVLARLSRVGAIPAHIAVAMINVRQEDRVEQEAVKRGVRGFFYVDESPEILLKGVPLLAQGEAWISRRILLDAAMETGGGKQAGSNGRDQLTQRETEILAMICVGARNEDIAGKLFISTNTVKTHIYNIYKKIRVPNRTQAALWAAKHL